MHGGLTTVDGELIDNDQVGNASHGVPAPLGRLVDLESSEETGEDHDEVSHDGDEDAGTIHAGQEAEVEQQERGGETPVNIAGPVDLTVDDVVGVWEVLLGVLDGDLILADTITDSHSIVGDGGEGGDEGSQDVEQSFLLGIGLAAVDRLVGYLFTYDRDTEGHDVEGQGRNEHDHEDDPSESQSSSVGRQDGRMVTNHSVRWPVALAVW